MHFHFPSPTRRVSLSRPTTVPALGVTSPGAEILAIYYVISRNACDFHAREDEFKRDRDKTFSLGEGRQGGGFLFSWENGGCQVFEIRVL